jgi:adenylate cyclase
MFVHNDLMERERVQRQLVCIMAADIAGYSAMMGTDEAGTLASVIRHRSEILEPLVARHSGRVFKTMGDGILAEFHSAVDAVQAAIEVQSATGNFEQAETGGASVALRIGVHLGDVIKEGDDVYGDGVNIASRLEGLADVGGILISDDVLRQVQGKIEARFENCGYRKLKNIENKINVFMVLSGSVESGRSVVDGRLSRSRRAQIFGAAAVLVVAVIAGAIWMTPILQKADGQIEAADVTIAEASKPSIGVLPFTDLSEDGDQAYFSDGLAEDLITDLSRMSGLVVLARSSTFAYRDSKSDIREVGRKLGARYLVDGSVRKFPDKVRVNAQLIDAETGTNIWAERYDRPSNDLFDVLEDLRSHIVGALEVKLTPREKKWLAKHPTSNPEAYDHYLRGLEQLSFFNADANLRARDEFEAAIGLDADFSAAVAQLAQTYSLASENGWTSNTGEGMAKALEYATRAVKLDDENPQAYWSLARIYTRPPYRDFERAKSALETAVSLDPNFADGYALLASVFNQSGQAERALTSIETAMTSNPGFPFWYYFELGRTQFFLTRFESAAQNFQKAIERNPTVPWPHRWLVSTYGHLGQMDDAEWEISELQSLGSAATVSDAANITTIVDPSYLALYVEGLRKAGMPE